MSCTLPDELLDIVIRFASSISDLPLQIRDPQHITTLSLKVLIRKHLPGPANQSRLNLIFAGKLLANNDTLACALNLRNRRRIPPPPSIKGKEPVRPTSLPPLYIQCSIGDVLSEVELATEVSNAAASEYALRNELPRPTFPTSLGNQHNAAQAQPAGPEANAPVPQLGFDRLLAMGWAAEDVLSLRASYLSHLSFSHTPATMPTGNALLALEERWLDSTGPGGLDGSAVLDEDTGAVLHFDDDESSEVDDTFWGSMLGFFWPYACWWGQREHGVVWSERRQRMVLLGVLINVAFGLMRMSTSWEDGT